MLPAGVIDRIDYDDEKIYVHRTKDEIKHAPEYDDSLSADTSYRERIASYYGPGGPGLPRVGRQPRAPAPAALAHPVRGEAAPVASPFSASRGGGHVCY